MKNKNEISLKSRHQMTNYLTNTGTLSSARGYNPMSTLNNVPNSTRVSEKKLIDMPRYNTVDNSQYKNGQLKGKILFDYYQTLTLLENIMMNHYNTYEHHDDFSPTVCKFCSETNYSIQNLYETLRSIMEERSTMTLEIIEKDGYIEMYEERLKKLQSKVNDLEKKWK